jgi:hypothetical protein
VPLSWEDVDDNPLESAVKLKPVTAVAAIGEMAISPSMSEVGTVEMPVFVRIT